MTTEATDAITEQGVHLARASHAQRRLWLMDQPDSQVTRAIRLPGALDLRALRRTLRELLRRHEVLRTTLAVEDDELVQIINPVADLPLRVTDLSAAADPESAGERFAEAARQRPFDIAIDLPIRADLLRLAQDDHVLLLTVAHVACDAWSAPVLDTEVRALYAACAGGQKPTLPEPPAQYADFARWQRQWLSDGEDERQLDHWRSVLSDAPRLAPLGSAPGGRSTRRSSTSVVTADLVRGLAELAAGEGVAPFAAVLAGFAAVLARHARQDEFVIGSTLSGRTRPELEPLVGHFANTVGLRVDLSGAPSFRALLGRVNRVLADADAHQEVPFERVVDALGGPPLFTVLCQLAPARQSAPADLALTATPVAGSYECHWDYRNDRYHSAFITLLQGHVTTLLRAAVADPDRPVSELDMITDAERRQLTAGWHTGADHDPTWCLPCRVAELAAERPDAVAVHADGHDLSYADLDRRANRLANLLRARGVAADTLVGICLPPGADQLVALLAVLKAGGAYLPLDPAYPRQRLAYMLTDAAPRLVIASAATADRVAGVDPARLVTPEESAAQPSTPLPCVARPDHLAYVIYTSGSTGRPKGTAVPRRGLGVIAATQQRLFGLTGADRVLRFAAFSFDASVFETLMAWGVGAGLYVPPTDEGIATDLAGFLARQEITAVVLPPTALAAMVDDTPLPDLRLVTVAGEACPPALAARWSHGRRFLNLYGPTEATIWSTGHEVTVEPTGAVPIGRPLPGLVGYVLTDTGDLAPVGVPGELHVGGPVLARGYLGRPGLTADRFVPDPFGDGGRLYRTGDLARWNVHGRLEFLGRIDDQVKIRGFRVELGEIEARLGAHPAVGESVAVVHDPDGAPVIVGYYTATDEPADLRDWCAAQLPGHMVPTHFVRVPRMPTNTSGKIDRRELATRPLPTPQPAADARPSSPLEEAIAEVWADVLEGHPAIGPASNFFDLGGNSLSATRVIIRLRSEFGVDLPIRTLFGSPVLADFTAAFRDIATASQ
jgi:amino acid adenylation domain-containing protein